MLVCSICGEPIRDGFRTCSVCGTRVADADISASPAAQDSIPMATFAIPVGDVAHTLPSAIVIPASGGMLTEGETTSQRLCPSCGRRYGPDHDDPYCNCGAELVAPAAPIAETPPPMPPSNAAAFLTLISSDRRPIQYFPLQKEASVLGRMDAVAGAFPDIDLQPWLTPNELRRISRAHVVFLKASTGDFLARPLPGNTGTQIESEMASAGRDYPLSPGTRMILGGTVRLRFDVARQDAAKRDFE